MLSSFRRVSWWVLYYYALLRVILLNAVAKTEPESSLGAHTAYLGREAPYLPASPDSNVIEAMPLRSRSVSTDEGQV
jgi:hypothetical protein